MMKRRRRPKTSPSVPPVARSPLRLRVHRHGEDAMRFDRVHGRERVRDSRALAVTQAGRSGFMENLALSV
jgi:hypothetical protein